MLPVAASLPSIYLDCFHYFHYTSITLDFILRRHAATLFLTPPRRCRFLLRRHAIRRRRLFSRCRFILLHLMPSAFDYFAEADAT